MDFAWGASWAWGLDLVAVTIGAHSLGIAMLSTVLHRVGAAMQRSRRALRFPTLFAANFLGCIGFGLAVLHGLGAVIWAAAYLWLGATDSMRDAVLYSVDSITTRGASGLTLAPEWRSLGALESAAGVLLFGISTAFAFAVLDRLNHLRANGGRQDDA